jgi:osmotically-inducible protein OsmY
MPARRGAGGGMNTTANPPEQHQAIVGHSRAVAIRRAAEHRLRCSGYLALRDVDCMASGDVLYLHGRLSSYFLKQIAQEIASNVEGVRRVINRIDVRRQSGHGAG